MNTSPLDASPEELVQDVKATRRDTISAMWHVSIVGMVASLFATGFLYGKFSGGEPVDVALAVAKGITIAGVVDYAMFRWMRIADRLRKIGAEPESGKALHYITAVMTIYLNGAAGIALAIEPSPTAAALMVGIPYMFIPVVMLLSFVAFPAAQNMLQDIERKQRADAERKRQAEIAEKEQQNRAAERRRKEEQDTQNARLERERANQLEQKRLDDQKHQREVEDRQKAREADIRRSVNVLAGALLTSTAMRAVVLASTRATNGSPAHSRQATTSPRRQSPPANVASGSPADRQRAASPNRQPRSPAASGPRPAKTSDLAELVTLAKELLAREPAMGRPTLAKQLAAATGTKITDYRAKQVLKAIEDEKEAQFQAELEAVMNGGVQ